MFKWPSMKFIIWTSLDLKLIQLNPNPNQTTCFLGLDLFVTIQVKYQMHSSCLTAKTFWFPLFLYFFYLFIVGRNAQQFVSSVLWAGMTAGVMALVKANGRQFCSRPRLCGLIWQTSSKVPTFFNLPDEFVHCSHSTDVSYDPVNYADLLCC